MLAQSRTKFRNIENLLKQGLAVSDAQRDPYTHGAKCADKMSSGA